MEDERMKIVRTAGGHEVGVMVERFYRDGETGYKVKRVWSLVRGEEIDVEIALRNDVVYQAARELVEQMRTEELIPNINLKEVK